MSGTTARGNIPRNRPWVTDILNLVTQVGAKGLFQASCIVAGLLTTAGMVPMSTVLAQKLPFLTHRAGDCRHLHRAIDSLAKPLGFFLQLSYGLFLDLVALKQLIGHIQQGKDNQIQG
jgi:hypothetical protein